MSTNAVQLVASALVMVLLSFAVAIKMYKSRVQEMKRKRVHPQAIATSAQMTARLENTQAADNFRNLFETPVVFYALVATALAVRNIPLWLVMGCWLYVALRLLHSVIQCTYNQVMHRFAAFVSSLVLLVILWVVYFFMLASATS
jgi:hypothetical protein